MVDRNRSRTILNRRGQALSEYAVLVAMVGMGLVVILGLFGGATKHVWQRSESQFASGDPSATSAPSFAPAGSSGGAVSGSVQPTPPPSSAPARPPKPDSSDSSSSAADSMGAGPNKPIGMTPGP